MELQRLLEGRPGMFNVNLYDDDATSELSKRTRSGSGHGWEADTVGRSGGGHGRAADTVGRRTRSDGREADTVGRRKAARALRTGFTVGSFAACDRFVAGRLRPGETVYVCRARSRVRGRRQYDYVWL